MAIVGLMMGVVVSKSGDWFGRNVKMTTGKLSSTIRYIRDKASTENLYIRMIFDFEKNSFWVEATTERFLLASKEVTEADAVEVEKEKEIEEDTEETIKGEDGEEETVSLIKKYRTPKFGAVDEFLLSPITLPNGVFLKDVYTSHDKGPISAGQAVIYFFPNGYIEPAIINLKDDDDETNFSVEINPITGLTKVTEEYKAMEQK